LTADCRNSEKDGKNNGYGLCHFDDGGDVGAKTLVKETKRSTGKADTHPPMTRRTAGEDLQWTV